ncbi:MAG: cob(I)yrinic acid a,c-diamide adenosyltransferase [Deltaproteobacteria bacterium]|jgi:cob(I)alamin adenosyltransferase|nr:cob(I)yrinic acid a,c-diamide adenosyltransferase [Deltaproteobacteria bacterium]MCW8892560.1 cob(I)yrinic acid a,c-diamide adenosyltransferase [Deltaproteobacteria bacterium]
MPKLDEIMTRGGDKGKTSLVDGSRVSKSSQRVKTYGTVDELNSVFGLVRCELLPDQLLEKVLLIQNHLFNLGGELATPIESEFSERLPKIEQSHIDRLEAWLEEARNQLEPAENFVLPGGTRAAAFLHLARTVTRRCERELVTLMETETINRSCLSFLNRLSDLCFVWARLSNDCGKTDILWNPGQSHPAS